MGVYVKDLDMPSNCVECKLPYEICGYSYRTDIRLRHERHENCPLVEVKEPHGRLIDADYIYNAVERRYRVSSGVEHRAERDFLDLISDAPTVLEAEDNDRN